MVEETSTKDQGIPKHLAEDGRQIGGGDVRHGFDQDFPKWTREQREAIDVRGENILVSAAAGSGKTAVLTERIQRLVTEDRVPVSSLLVVTFTEAAASEMRRRIEDALGAVAEGGGNDDFLRRQLRRLHSAQISTFHSFALSILKNYYYVIGMAPSFRVVDEFRAALMKQDALDLLFEERFASGDGAFTDFLSKYADSRNENGARGMVLSVYGFIRSLPEPFEWLDGSVGSLGASDAEFYKGAAFAWVRRKAISELRRAIEEISRIGEMLEDGGAPHLAEKNAVDLATVAEVSATFDGGDGWDRMAEALSFKFQAFRAKKDEKENYETIRDDVNALRNRAKKRLKTLAELYFARPFSELVSDVRDTQRPAAELGALVRRFDEIFSGLKRDEGVIDFDDIEHFALDILKDDMVAEELRRKYEHIFVDEYQDSNYVQETLISKICRPDNRFMVGDVKQSIYRFRNAEPGIFTEKYLRYPHEDGSRRVDLNMNFRSKAPVIDAVNGVFSRLMGEEGGAPDEPGLAAEAYTSGAVGYGEDAALKLGLAYDRKWDVSVELRVVDVSAVGGGENSGGAHAGADDGSADSGIGEDAPGGAGGALGGADDALGLADGDSTDATADEILSLKDAEREALAAAAVIREARGRVFFDAKTGKCRPMEYRDMVILLREASASGPVFTETLLSEGIDTYAESGDGYLGTVEIETFMNLLRVVDNTRQDVPLVSALYSPVFGFTTDELAEIRVTHGDRGCPFHKAFHACASRGHGAPSPERDGGVSSPEWDGGGSDTLDAKCAAALERIRAWRREESFMELSDFLWLLLKESGWYDYAGGLVGGALRQANLLAMTVRAAEYGSGGARGLFGFIRHIEAVDDKRLPMPQAKLVAEGEDVVRVMTIHKSKGLEYPLVIVAGLGKKLDAANRTGRLSLHRELGLALTREDPGTHSWRRTLLMSAVSGIAKDEDRAELLRVLYVAMTRAQDRLVLIGSMKGAAEKLAPACDGGIKTPDAESPADGRIYGAWPTADVSAGDAATFLEMLLPLSREAGIALSVVTPAGLARTAADGVSVRDGVAAKLGEIETGDGGGGSRDSGLYAEIDRRLSFAYPHAAATRLKSKYSVTELNRWLSRPHELPKAYYYMEESASAADEDEGRVAWDEALVASEPASPETVAAEAAAVDWAATAETTAVGGAATTETTATREAATSEAAAGETRRARRTSDAALRGTALHRAIEKLDYAEARARCSDEASADGADLDTSRQTSGSPEDVAWFDGYLDGLVRDGFLMPEQRDSVGARDIARFASSDICARAAASPRARRETPFNYRMGMEGEQVVVQGVIDLFFEEGDGLVLVDFKSGDAHRTPDERARHAVEAYGEQIRIYRAALEAITRKRVEEALFYLTDSGQTVPVPREETRSFDGNKQRVDL